MNCALSDVLVMYPLLFMWQAGKVYIILLSLSTTTLGILNQGKCMFVSLHNLCVHACIKAHCWCGADIFTYHMVEE